MWSDQKYKLDWLEIRCRPMYLKNILFRLGSQLIWISINLKVSVINGVYRVSYIELNVRVNHLINVDNKLRIH